MDPSEAQTAQADRLLSSVGIGVPAGQDLTVFKGETVRVSATIDYRGPAGSVRLYAAIGTDRPFLLGGFDEHWAATAAPFSLPESIDWVSHTLSVDIVIVGGPGSGIFDLYAKILETGAPGMPMIFDVIRVVGDAEFQNLAIASYVKA